MRIKSTLLAGLALAVSVTAAIAEPVTAKQAKKMLFKGAKFQVEVIPGAQIDVVTQVQVEGLIAALQDPKIARQWQASGFSVNYYGAIAVMPDRPLSEKTMGFSDNLHSREAAMARAVEACNALDGPTCVAVALILPKRFKPQPLSLSFAATEAFRDSWGRPNEPQYLAFSQSTGAYSIVKGVGGDAVAVESCNAAENSGKDCVIGIIEE